MRKILLAAALAAIATPAPAVNLVVNGGFEMTLGGKLPNFEFGASFPANANAVIGWQSPLTNAYNLLWNPATAFTAAGNAQTRFGGGSEWLWPGSDVPGGDIGGPSPTGGYFIGLDGDSSVRGPVQQMINGLVPGRDYLLTLDIATGQIRSRRGDTTEQLRVSLGSETYFGPVIANPDRGFQAWRPLSFTFTADSASELLSFLSLGTPNGLPPIIFLDSIRLEKVPAPSALVLFGLGAMAVAGARLRRR